MVAGSCPKVVFLSEPPLVERSGLKWAKEPAQLERTVLAPCANNLDRLGRLPRRCYRDPGSNAPNCQNSLKRGTLQLARIGSLE